MAVIMFLNVWLVIWPAQKKVIASAQKVAAGGEPDPEAAAAGRRGAVASRTNTLFSIPMLFFMGAASHFSFRYNTSDNRGVYYLVLLVIVGLIELNALGVFGGVGPSPLRRYADSHRDTIIAGFVLWLIIYAIWEIMF
jgi:hypothetical protein